jgi:hypothetical protein
MTPLESNMSHGCLGNLPVPSVHRTPPSALAPRARLWEERRAVWQDPGALWYALAGTATRGTCGLHGWAVQGAPGVGGPPRVDA